MITQNIRVLAIFFTLLFFISCGVLKDSVSGKYHYEESKGSMSVYWDINIKQNDSVYFETNVGRFRKSRGVVKKVSNNKYSIVSYDIRDSTIIPSGIIPIRLDIVNEIIITKRNKIIFRNYVLRREK